MKLLFTCLLGLLYTFSIGQDKQHIKPGIYAGTISENSTQITYRIEVDSDGYLYQVDANGIHKQFDFKQTSSHNKITTLEWINSGGLWTETQIFMITKLTNSVLQVIHIRYVTNDDGDTSTDFFYGGSGKFYLIQ